MTAEEAALVARLCLAVPDLPLGAIRPLVAAYRSFEHQRWSTASLDHALAFAPCRSRDEAAAYTSAINVGSPPASARCLI
jgi:hypothetical protein